MNRLARALLPALFAVTALSRTLPTGVQKKASMGGMAGYGFPNGLKALWYPDAANPQTPASTDNTASYLEPNLSNGIASST